MKNTHISATFGEKTATLQQRLDTFISNFLRFLGNLWLCLPTAKLLSSFTRNINTRSSPWRGANVLESLNGDNLHNLHNQFRW